jgi:hypothetical protein
MTHNHSIQSYDEYIDIIDSNLDRLDEIRRQLIVQCKQLYQRIQSASQYTESDYTEYDIDDFILDPERYDWFDDISDAEASKVYRLYEKALNKSKEVSDILDTIDDVAYLIDRCDDDLLWVGGE